MKIAFTNDHAGVPERERIIAKLKEMGHEVVDYGTKTAERVDYPDYAAPAAEALSSGKVDRAVMMCGSGMGMSIVANRFPRVRCALATDLYGAEMSRRHNDANCLALRSREQDPELNDKILDVWLKTQFEGGRHQNRVAAIEKYDGGACGTSMPSEEKK